MYVYKKLERGKIWWGNVNGVENHSQKHTTGKCTAVITAGKMPAGNNKPGIVEHIGRNIKVCFQILHYMV